MRSNGLLEAMKIIAGDSAFGYTQEASRFSGSLRAAVGNVFDRRVTSSGKSST
jgi:hypothetical protein